MAVRVSDQEYRGWQIAADREALRLPELLREAARFRMLAFGLAMVGIVYARPQGILGRVWVGEPAKPEGESARSPALVREA